MDFNGARDYILQRLDKELNPALYYHSVAHTKGVWESTLRLAEMEHVGGNELKLLETAALFHDSGMLIQYSDHEMTSANLAREILPEFAYANSEIDLISSLILMTRLPQSAKTLLEEILCDADLDYLGREDFFIHSFELQLEWIHNGIKKTSFSEWMEVQLQFLSAHQYFTKSAIRLRQEQKMKNLSEIQKLFNIINYL